MSVKCIDIIKHMEKLAPLSLAENWDNVGLMLGDYNSEIKKVLVALDVNDEVIDEAIKNNADMIITHHPFIFTSIKHIIFNEPLGRRIVKLIKNDISVYSAHTNLDIAEGGTNDTLAEILSLKNIEGFLPCDNDRGFLGKVGFLQDEMSFFEFTMYVKEKLGLDIVSVSGKKERRIKKVALCTGKCSGKDYMLQAKKCECDVYITGDMGYHDAQLAEDLGLCVIDVTHYSGEALVVDTLCKYLNHSAKTSSQNFVCIASEINGQTIKYI